jgi:hypothetical protein
MPLLSIRLQGIILNNTIKYADNLVFYVYSEIPVASLYKQQIIKYISEWINDPSNILIVKFRVREISLLGGVEFKPPEAPDGKYRCTIFKFETFVLLFYRQDRGGTILRNVAKRLQVPCGVTPQKAVILYLFSVVYNLVIFSFLGVGWDWVHLVRRPLTGLLYQPLTIDDECAVVGGMRIGKGNRSTRRKPAPVSLWPPQIPHDLTWDRTRAAAVGSLRLTAWAMARPTVVCTSWLCCDVSEDFNTISFTTFFVLFTLSHNEFLV